MKRYACLVLVGLYAVQSIASADVIDVTSSITNPSFETNGATETGADRIPGWTVTSPNTDYSNNPVMTTPAAKDGSRAASFWLNFNINGNGQAIQQVVAVLPNVEYTLSYWLVQTGNTSNATMTATVLDNAGAGSQLDQNVTSFNHKTWQ